MRPPPTEIGGTQVVRWSPIDSRHRPTAACRHVVGSEVAGVPVAVAICNDEASGGYFLFGCDAGWQAITDTWHETLEQACAQAEFEFSGVSSTWL